MASQLENVVSSIIEVSMNKIVIIAINGDGQADVKIFSTEEIYIIYNK